jgi:hypothetical protein
MRKLSFQIESSTIQLNVQYQTGGFLQSGSRMEVSD